MNSHSGSDKNTQPCLMIDEQVLLEELDPNESRHGEFIELGQKIGARALNDLMECFGSQKKHIPTARVFWENLRREIRDREIKAQFNGSNYQELADKYDLTIRHVNRILFGKNRRA